MGVGHVATAVETLQLVGAQGMVGATGAAQAAVEAQHGVAGAAHHLEVVGDLQDRPALAAAQLVEEVVKAVAGAGIEAGLGLIEDQQAAGTHDAEGEQHALLLSGGEIAEQALGQVVAVGLGEGGAHGLGAGARAVPRQGWAGLIPPQPDEFGDGEGQAAAQGKALGEVGHLAAHRSAQLAPRTEPVTQKVHRSPVVGEDSEQGLHQGAFAGAIGPNQRRVGFAAQLEADVVDDRPALAPHREVADFENRFHHHANLAEVRRILSRGSQALHHRSTVAAHGLEVVGGPPSLHLVGPLDRIEGQQHQIEVVRQGLEGGPLVLGVHQQAPQALAPEFADHPPQIGH